MTCHEDKLVIDDNKIVEILNDFYVNIIKRTTGIAPNNKKDDIDPDTSTTEIVSKIVDCYKNHPSVKYIKDNLKMDENVSFKKVSTNEILTELNNLNIHW